MTFYSGADLSLGPVTLCLPDPREIQNFNIAADVAEAVTQWLPRAMSDSDTLYFAIRLDGMLAGQVFLYDLGLHAGEAQVGLHLFDPAMRGRGVGAVALALLQQYVVEQTTLKRLVFTVATNHIAALRAAEKCGFHNKGKPKPDATEVTYTWKIPAN